jgi:hypothetical protein
LTLTYSPDSKKKGNSSNSHQNNTVINNINTTYANNVINTSNTNGSNSNNSNKTDNIKDIINKRKLLIQKQKERDSIMKEQIKKITFEKVENNLTKHLEAEDYSKELLDIVKDFDLTNHSHPNLNTTNVKITNITNYIVGHNSFDVNRKPNDTMLRDINALNFITQKALSTNTKHNPIDSIDDERKSFCKFQNINTKKALFIDDNTELSMNNNSQHYTNRDNNSNSFAFFNNDSQDEGGDKEKKRKQIINIININNNYNIGSINIPAVEKNTYNVNNYYTVSNSNASQKSNKSFKNMNMKNYKKVVSNNSNLDITPNQTPIRTPNQTPKQDFGIISNKALKKLIPKNASSGSKDFNNFNNNRSIKDILSTVKKDQSNQKYIKLSN